MGRLVALDRLRALAVVSMVQGHTFTALLREGALSTWARPWHAALHGLTAPAFLFGAGLAFAITTYPSYERHQAVGPALSRRLRRYALLLALGYALQLPGASLASALSLRGEQLLPILRVGPLHLIALCLGACQLMALVLRPAAHALLALALALAVVIAAPHVWAAGLGAQAGLVLGPWLDGRSGSLFPIFPWASYALFGVACGFSIVHGGLPHGARIAMGRPARARDVGAALGGKPALEVRVFAVGGALLATASYALFRAGVRLAPSDWFWQAGALNVAFRLGMVCLFLGLLQPHRAVEADAPPARPLSAWIARHSLAAYVIHLLLLYGTPFTPNLHRRVGPTLSAPSATLAFAAILGLTLALVALWSALRERVGQRWLELGLAVALGVVLVR